MIDKDNLFSPLWFKLAGEDLSSFKSNYLLHWLLLCAITTAACVVTAWVPAAQIEFHAATGEEQNAAIGIIIRSGRELQFVLWVTRENGSVGFLWLVVCCRYCVCFDILCEFWVKRAEILLELTGFWCSWMKAGELSCRQDGSVSVSGFFLSYRAYLQCNQFMER